MWKKIEKVIDIFPKNDRILFKDVGECEMKKIQSIELFNKFSVCKIAIQNVDITHYSCLFYFNNVDFIKTVETQ